MGLSLDHCRWRSYLGLNHSLSSLDRGLGYKLNGDLALALGMSLTLSLLGKDLSRDNGRRLNRDLCSLNGDGDLGLWDNLSLVLNHLGAGRSSHWDVRFHYRGVMLRLLGNKSLLLLDQCRVLLLLDHLLLRERAMRRKLSGAKLRDARVLHIGRLLLNLLLAVTLWNGDGLRFLTLLKLNDGRLLVLLNLLLYQSLLLQSLCLLLLEQDLLLTLLLELLLQQSLLLLLDLLLELRLLLLLLLLLELGFLLQLVLLQNGLLLQMLLN